MTVYNKLAYQRGELLSKQHAPRNVEARLARRFNGEVGRLNKWVEEVRAETNESIPYLDSDAASKGVRILMLFQDPSGAAEGDSGFISKHNNDPTARNYYEATEAAGVPYDITLNWNVVPWWSTNNPLFPGRTVNKEAPRAAPYLVDFIRLLSEPPRVLVLSGDKAQKAWDRIAWKIDAEVIRDTVILRCPHPSPLSYNAANGGDGRKNYLHIIETFREAARIAG
ncbi:uracil-DNA glycosylase family protein [Williamsia muralis]|uniref:Uracil-DNA glycosylase-like domain-containing protein n=1 Tax=Williamsia marianensis TaxID=85044 RepID=A0A2G3PRJ5_WILMA|nr:uracil-DNA glycosylase family protein [Williamsia marianensis]PHV68467.1 hypothetical protein CSW57_04420 [Williamsia marianensis]